MKAPTTTDPEKNPNYIVGGTPPAPAPEVDRVNMPDNTQIQIRRVTRERGGAIVKGISRLYAMKNRKAIEGAALRVANLVLAKNLGPQEAHAVLHALRLMFDSMKLTEEINAEYQLKAVASQMAEMRETNQALYQRLVELGIAPAIEEQKLLA